MWTSSQGPEAVQRTTHGPGQGAHGNPVHGLLTVCRSPIYAHTTELRVYEAVLLIIRTFYLRVATVQSGEEHGFERGHQKEITASASMLRHDADRAQSSRAVPAFHPSL